MSLQGLDGFGWLLLLLGPLLLFQRWLHREIQAVLIILTRRPAVAVGLFSILFFPGVLLHEASHFLAARLLGVRTGRFSLIPRPMPGGRLRLGYVETAPADPVRDTLVGAAPLISGAVVIAVIAVRIIGLQPLGDELVQGRWVEFLRGFLALPEKPDFWLWFYLIFVVSSTMLPSPSDRRAWLPVLAGVLLLAGLGLLAGAGPWMATNLGPIVNRGMRGLAAVFGISLAVHLLLVFPFWAAHRLLSALMKVDVG